MALQEIVLTEIGSKGHHRFTLTVTEESTDINANSSEISWSFQISAVHKGYDWFSLSKIRYTLVLNGTTYTGNIRDYDGKSTITLKSNVETWQHNDDGTKEVSLSFEVTDGHTFSFTPGNASASDVMSLTEIPRASTIAASDANIESTSTVVVNRKNSAFQHTIAVTFGNLNGYINADGDMVSTAVKLSNTIIAFKVPSSFYSQIPDKSSELCTLTCVTYNDDVVIGSAQSCTFNATAALNLCKPDVTAEIIDINEKTTALTENERHLVRYFSTVQCTTDVIAKNSATIKSVKVNDIEVTDNVLTIQNVETDSFTVTATDSRDYTTTITEKADNFIPYVKLTCVASVKRVAPTTGEAQLSIKGAYFNDTFGRSHNSLQITYQVDAGEPILVDTTLDGNTYEALVNLNDFDYTKSFEFTVIVRDELDEVVKSITLQPGIPVFDWGKNDFAFHVPVSFQGSTLVDFVVETGTTDIWEYRKWASGKVECWGRVDTTIAFLTQKGALYFSEPTTLFLPFTIVDAYTYVSAVSENNVSASITDNGDDLISICLQCPTVELEGSSATVFLYTKGLWNKEV